MDVDNLSGAGVAQLLASCNKSTRDRALRRLDIFLCSPSCSTSVSDDELLKIWKGLFYCVWHADKLLVQVDLIDRLSSLLSSLGISLAARYFQAFLATIRREWSGIDHLRLDKFYLLIRRFVNKFFRFLSEKKWDADTVRLMVGVFEETSLLLVDDKYPAQGVNYHISQVYLDEMMEFLPVNMGIMESLVRPFFHAIETSRDKVLVKKVKDNVFGRLLQCGAKYLETVKKSKNSGEVEVESEIEKLGKVALLMGFAKRFFASASAQGTVQGNRKVLFTLHQGFLKMEKDLESSGVKVLIEQVEEDAMQVDRASVGKSSSMKKKKTKPKKVLSGSCNKSKSKKNCKGSGLVANGDADEVDGNPEENGTSVQLEEIIMSKLQEHFERDFESSDPNISLESGERVEEDAVQVDVLSVEKSSNKKNKSKNASSTVGSKSKNKKKCIDYSGSVADESAMCAFTPTNEGLQSSKEVNVNAQESDTTVVQKQLKKDLDVEDAMQVDVPSEEKSSKKKKSKNASSTSGSKSKKKKCNGFSGLVANEGGIIGASTPANGNLEATEKVNGDAEESEISLHFDEVVMSNLQTQFEKVAAEAGMVTPSSTFTKKRKRPMSTDVKVNGSNDHCDDALDVKSAQKSVKTVRFSMKNNLVWKPQTPLPPQSLRLPPSTTPRGSALKKGIPPGPVRKTPPSTKKARSNPNTKTKTKTIYLKKSRKSAHGVSLIVKRPWK